jgi:dephospho-CoA kinase
MATTSRIESSASDRGRFRIGLTGGIGSGKSVVADLLAALGAAIVDTDAIAHQLTQVNGLAIEPIRRVFGDAFIDTTGALDRPRMRQLVFSDPAERARLESILHPLIRQHADQRAADATLAPYIVFAVPLLVEAGDWKTRVDRVLVVDCPIPEQVQRVVATRGLPPSQVVAIVAQQASRAKRLAAADDVLVNAGTVAQLPPRVGRLHAHYCSLATMARSASRPL